MILKQRFLPCLLLTLLIVACGGGDDSTSPPDEAGDAGGSLTMGSDRANTLITEQNKKYACEDIFSVIYSSYSRTVQSMMSVADEGVANMQLSGNMYGYATTDGFIELTGNTLDGVDFEFELTYFDFSDNGKLYLGGKVGFEGHLNLVGERWISSEVYVNKKAAFAGDYKGMLQFGNLRFPVDESGNLYSLFAADSVLSHQPHDGKVTITSGSNTIEFSPFYRIFIPADPEPE